MSLGEILVVVIIAIMVIKPQDVPLVVKKYQQFKLYYFKMKNELLTYLSEEIKTENNFLEDIPEKLNFYLEKIINLQGYYDGNYALSDLKKKYEELINTKLAESSFMGADKNSSSLRSEIDKAIQ